MFDYSESRVPRNKRGKKIRKISPPAAPQRFHTGYCTSIAPKTSQNSRMSVINQRERSDPSDVPDVAATHHQVSPGNPKCCRRATLSVCPNRCCIINRRINPRFPTKNHRLEWGRRDTSALACRLFYPGHMPIHALIQLNHRLFWSKKMRIALLALVTFLAMC